MVYMPDRVSTFDTLVEQASALILQNEQAPELNLILAFLQKQYAAHPLSQHELNKLLESPCSEGTHIRSALKTLRQHRTAPGHPFQAAE